MFCAALLVITVSKAILPLQKLTKFFYSTIVLRLNNIVSQNKKLIIDFSCKFYKFSLSINYLYVSVPRVGYNFNLYLVLSELNKPEIAEIEQTGKSIVWCITVSNFRKFA